MLFIVCVCVSSPFYTGIQLLLPSYIQRRENAVAKTDCLLGGLERLVTAADSLHALEVLCTVDQSALRVRAGVDKVWVIESELGGTVDDAVDSLYTEHKRV